MSWSDYVIGRLVYDALPLVVFAVLGLLMLAAGRNR